MYRVWSFQRVLLTCVVALVVYLVLVPLLFLLFVSFQSGYTTTGVVDFTWQNYSQAYLDPDTYGMMLNTLVFAVGSTAMSLVLGISFAWFLERTNIPLKNLFYSLIPLPFIIPGMLQAITWILLLSPRIGIINLTLKNILPMETSPFDIYSLGGMIFVEGLRLVPTMFLMMVGSFRGMDQSLEEAGAVSGAGLVSVQRLITLPLLLPAILSAVIYNFVTAVEAFEIPGILGLTAGVPVFSTRIYLSTRHSEPDYGLGSAFAVTFIIVSILLMLVYTRMTRHAERFTTITGKGFRPRVMDLGPWRHVGCCMIVVYIALALVLPVLVLLWGSLQTFYQVPSVALLHQSSLKAYAATVNHPRILLAFRNTLWLMLATATFTTVLGSLISWIVVRSRMRGRHFLDTIAFLSHGIPSIVVGLALIIVYIRLDVIPIYGTLWVMIIGLSTRFMAFPVRTISSGMHQIHQELEEAAWMNGSTWWQTFTRITVPLLVPTLASAWIWIAMVSARELSAALMLSTAKTTVLSVIIWDFWTDGSIPQTCALGMILIVSIAGITILARLLGFRAGRDMS